MQLRLATPEDALDVARVHVRSWQAGYRGILPDAYLDALRPEDRAARYHFGEPDPGRPSTLVAVEGRTICGFVTTGPSPAGPDGEVMALYVDPDHWRRGIGRVLIAAGREALTRLGYVSAVLWLLQGNARGARFYETDGWELDGRARSLQVWGISVDEVGYRRSL